MNRQSVTIPKEDFEKLSQVAKFEDRTKSYLIRKAIRQFLDTYEWSEEDSTE